MSVDQRAGIGDRDPAAPAGGDRIDQHAVAEQAQGHARGDAVDVEDGAPGAGDAVADRAGIRAGLERRRGRAAGIDDGTAAGVAGIRHRQDGAARGVPHGVDLSHAVLIHAVGDQRARAAAGPAVVVEEADGPRDGVGHGLEGGAVAQQGQGRAGRDIGDIELREHAVRAVDRGDPVAQRSPNRRPGRATIRGWYRPRRSSR